jgi:hypothetical protein
VEEGNREIDRGRDDEMIGDEIKYYRRDTNMY